MTETIMSPSSEQPDAPKPRRVARRALIFGTGAVLLAGAAWSGGYLPEPDLDDVLPDANLLPIVDDAALPAGARKLAEQTFERLHKLASGDDKVVEQRIFFLKNLPSSVSACESGSAPCDPTSIRNSYENTSSVVGFSTADKLRDYGYRPSRRGAHRTYNVRPVLEAPPVEASPSYFSPLWGSHARFCVALLFPLSNGSRNEDYGYYWPKIQQAQDAHDQRTVNEALAEWRSANIRSFQEQYGAYGIYGFFKLKPQ